MRHIISSRALAVVSLVVTACSDAPSNPSGLESFEATLPAAAWVEAGGGRCHALTVTITGSGHATPGGDFTLGASHCMEPAGADSFDILYPKFTDGQFAFTFASGTTLTGTYQGNLVLTETGLYGVQADLSFTGGTGDFAHPSGSASFSDVPDSTVARLNRQTGQATNLHLSGLFVP